MTAPAHAPRPGEAPDHVPDVSRFIDFLVGQAEEPAAPAAFWIAGSVGPRLADGEARYRLLKPIGRGAWATVYEASDRLLASETSEALVAVKLGHCPTAMDAGRWLDEARNARRVEHPNVVRVLDCGLADDGRVFTVLELVEGLTLDEHAAGHSRPRRELVGYIAQAAKGLEAIHAAGLVHCDIKPSNLLRGADGTIKITDFGAAAGQTRKAPLSDPATPDARGTLAFMAPEQFRMERGALTPSTDIFSLGAALYWLLTGESVAGETPLEAAGALADADGPDTATIERRLRDRRVDRRLRTIVKRALAPRQHDRYASAGVLAADLTAWLDHRSIEWMKPGPVQRARLLCRRRPVAAGACALALAAGVATCCATLQASRLASENAAREVELRVERAARQTESAWRKRSLDNLMRLLAGFRSAKEQGLGAEVLTSLWVLEWAHGPMLLQDPVSTGEIWRTRIDVLQSMRARARAAHGPDSIEARLAEPSLALWLLRDGRAAEAQPLIRDAIAFWERHAAADDAWMDDLRVLESVAVVLQARQTGPDEAGSRDAEVATHRAKLVALGDATMLDGRKGPIVQLVAQVLNN